MGVIYKLKDEVVQFIISQRQSNPLFSCRQLAESASQKFDLHLSKSSVHDVLKESGIVTPRGRKPKDRFEIPQEKKKQIQVSLSQVKLLPAPKEPEIDLIVDVAEADNIQHSYEEASPEYEGAGKIFLKAALWDLGIYVEENIRSTDWDYYLTYCKGVKIILENNKDIFIDLALPIERCIFEVADGLVNNVKPFILNKISDEESFKACMDAQPGFKIRNISIVDRNDHIILEFCDIMEYKRNYYLNNRSFMESNEIDFLKRAMMIFFPEYIGVNNVMDKILKLKGFDSINGDENNVSLLIDDGYDKISMLQEAVEILNGMFLRDEQGRLVKVSLILPGRG